MELEKTHAGGISQKVNTFHTKGVRGSMTPPPLFIKEQYGTYYWRPNNYRRQIKVNRRNYKIDAFIKEHFKSAPHPQNKIISLQYRGITLQYAKDHLTGIYKQNIIQGVKQVYEFHGTPNQVDAQIKDKAIDICRKIDGALYSFIKECKLLLPIEKPIWVRHEDFLRGEEYIESIPKEVIIHTSGLKKVYGKGVEFMGEKKGDKPAEKIANYIKTRAIEDIAPQIAESIQEVKDHKDLIQKHEVLKKAVLLLLEAFEEYMRNKV